MKWKTEKYADGKYDAIATDDNGEFPRRLGHITGARDVWMAEVPYKDLGYYKTKKAALKAISAFRERDGYPIRA